MKREPFMKGLEAALDSDDVNSTGSLCLIRLSGLMPLNQKYGHKVIDSMLGDMGKALNRIAVEHSRWAASRLNGSDFALMAPRATNADEAAREVQAVFQEILENRSMEHDI